MERNEEEEHKESRDYLVSEDRGLGKQYRTTCEDMEEEEEEEEEDEEITQQHGSTTPGCAVTNATNVSANYDAHSVDYQAEEDFDTHLSGNSTPCPFRAPIRHSRHHSRCDLEARQHPTRQDSGSVVSWSGGCNACAAEDI